MAYKKQIFEILRELDPLTQEQRVDHLRKNDNITLRLMLRQNFDPSIVFKLPDGDPPFKKNNVPIGYTENNLYAETRRLGYIFTAPPSGVRAAQLEGLFISLLEALHPNECKVLLAVKNKRLQTEFAVTEDLVLTAFPNLFPRSAPVQATPAPVPPKESPKSPKEPKLNLRSIKGPKTDSMVVPFV